jgi:hypothetical protein
VRFLTRDETVSAWTRMLEEEKPSVNLRPVKSREEGKGRTEARGNGKVE